MFFEDFEQFQFHDGTIDSELRKAMKEAQTAFQFHDGTIDSSDSKLNSLHENTNFNSTMVRLIVLSVHSGLKPEHISIPRWYDW